MSTIKRVYVYTVFTITLGMFATGGQILLRLFFDIIKGQTLIEIGAPGFNRQQLSLGLALLLIGGILWFFFWRAIQRQVTANPDELGTAIRKLFLNLILVVTAFVSLYTAAGFLQWLLAGITREQFSPGGLATLIVAISIWYYYRRVSEREGQPSPAARTLRRWYVYLLSGWGLVSLSVGLVQLINQSILFLPVWGNAIAYGGFWNSSVHSNLGWTLLGGAAWGFHWFHMARGDSDSTLRHVYLYLLAIPGGAIAVLVPLTTSLFSVFTFALGGFGVASDRYFLFLGWTVPTMLVAAAIWTYHQKVVQEEAEQRPERQSSEQRVLRYIMSFIGLGTLVTGLIVLLGILLELLTNAISRGPIAVTLGWWHQQLSLCLALLLVALPIWLYYWNRVLQMVAGNDVAERTARSRRIFLYMVMGVAIIILAADLVNIIYQLLNGLLKGTFGAEIFSGSKWSLQSLVIAIPVLWYHWRVLRHDQRLRVEKGQLRKTVTILAGEPAQDLVSLIEEKLGSHTRRLRYLGQTLEDIPVLSDEEADKLVSDIRAVLGNKVLVVVAGGKVMVLPYKEK